MNQTLLNQELFSFIKESPTNYHAITAASRLLADQGFSPLSEQDAWTLLPGGKYYVSRGETSLFAFRMPEKPLPLSPFRSLPATAILPALN